MKNNKLKILVSLIVILNVCLLSVTSQAAMEVKAGTIPYINIKPTDSYKLCYDLRNSDSTLGNNTLDPHLILNKDWGAVAYLGLSTYGAIKDQTGPIVVIEGQNYTSTTGNISGVINLGYTDTITSSILPGARDSSGYINIKNNLNTKYVETLPTNPTIANTKGQACSETRGWFGTPTNGTYPYLSFNVLLKRIGLLGYGNNDGTAALQILTFRPVIWN